MSTLNAVPFRSTILYNALGAVPAGSVLTVGSNGTQSYTTNLGLNAVTFSTLTGSTLGTTSAVGIATTSPVAILDVLGSFRVLNQTYTAIASGTGVDIIYSGGGQITSGTRSAGVLTAATMAYAASSHTWYVGSSAGTNAMTINSSGQIGIGTANTITKALIYQDGNSLLNEGNTHSFGILSSQGTYASNQMYMMLDADYTNQCCSVQSIIYGLKVWNLSFNPRGGNVGIGTTNPAYLLDVNGTGVIRGVLGVPTSNTGQLYNYTVTTTAGRWYKVISMTDSQSKATFRVKGTIVGGSNPHACSSIDILISTDNASGAIYPQISQTDSYNAMSWTDFGLVFVMSSGYATLYIKAATSNVYVNLDVSASSKNGSGAPIIYTSSSIYTLAFSGTMTTSIDTALTGSITQFDIYTNANAKYNIMTTATGAVGIGTSSPNYLLSVSGTSGGGIIEVNRTGAGAAYGSAILYSLTSSSGSFRGEYARTFGGSNGTIATSAQSQANGYYCIDIANAGVFQSNTNAATSAFYMTNTQATFNVPLQVNGTITGSRFNSVSGSLTVGTSATNLYTLNGTQSGWLNIYWGNGSALYFFQWISGITSYFINQITNNANANTVSLSYTGSVTITATASTSMTVWYVITFMT